VVPASLTHRLRLAVVSTTVPWHQSAVVGASLKGPLVPTLRLDATSPMEEIVSALNDFQPESLVAYAGMAKALALEQLDSRLRVNPRSVMCASEVLTSGARRVIREAFGSEPYETYEATEAAGIASDCYGITCTCMKTSSSPRSSTSTTARFHRARMAPSSSSRSCSLGRCR